MPMKCPPLHNKCTGRLRQNAELSDWQKLKHLTTRCAVKVQYGDSYQNPRCVYSWTWLCHVWGVALYLHVSEVAETFILCHIIGNHDSACPLGGPLLRGGWFRRQCRLHGLGGGRWLWRQEALCQPLFGSRKGSSAGTGHGCSVIVRVGGWVRIFILTCVYVKDVGRISRELRRRSPTAEEANGRREGNFSSCTVSSVLTFEPLNRFTSFRTCMEK